MQARVRRHRRDHERIPRKSPSRETAQNTCCANAKYTPRISDEHEHERRTKPLRPATRRVSNRRTGPGSRGMIATPVDNCRQVFAGAGPCAQRLVLDLALNYDQHLPPRHDRRAEPLIHAADPGLTRYINASRDRQSTSTPGQEIAMDYDIVIANGTVVSADGESRADVAIRGERIAAVGPGLAEGGVAPHQDRRRLRAAGDSRRGRRARSPRAAVLRHGLERRLEDRHPRGGARRRDDRHRLCDPLRQRDAHGRIRQLDGASQAQGVRRLLLSHGHHQLGPARPRDGKDGRHGLPDIQGIHDLCIRGLAGRRPGDLTTRSSGARIWARCFWSTPNRAACSTS